MIIPPDGTKVRLLRDIIDSATGDHPEMLHGKKGQIVAILDFAPETWFPVIVIDDSGHHFGIKAGEFELINQLEEK